ncbi:MAG TPA: hypothetical protein VFZ98_01185 [Vicinamibacterales bacterium]
MAWVGTGAVWTMAGGVLRATPLGHPGHFPAPSGGLRFVQISDSHIGFDKPANPDVTATLRDAVARIKASSDAPSFVLHTGDLTHLSKPQEFDTLHCRDRCPTARGNRRFRRRDRGQLPVRPGGPLSAGRHDDHLDESRRRASHDREYGWRLQVPGA